MIVLGLVIAGLAPSNPVDVVVVERETGKPIPSFHLWVTPSSTLDRHRDAYGMREQVSRDVNDVNGRVVVTMPDGPTVVGVSAAGFRDGDTERIEVSRTSSPVVQFRLEKSNALRGTIRDARTGKPIAGATITLGGAAGPRLFGASLCTTNARGEFEVRSLPPQRFSVVVHAPTYRQLIVGGIRGDACDDQRLDLELDDGDGLSELVGIGARIGDGALVIDVARTAPRLRRSSAATSSCASTAPSSST